ncbi:MAG: WG repeat-containing protein [Rikenellaceae bacterium]
MKYPSTIQYIEALTNASTNLKSTPLKGLRLSLDESGEPIYSTSNSTSSLLFDITITHDKTPVDKTLRVFLNEKAAQNFTSTESSTLYPSALSVATDGESCLYDIIIEERVTRKAPTVRTTSPSAELREDRIAYKNEEEKWGYKDSNGYIVIEAIYDSVTPFHEMRAVVSLNQKYGLINIYGQRIIALDYDDLSYDNSCFCVAEIEGKHGVINRAGEVIIPLEWDWISDFSNGAFVVEKDNKFGLMDINGRAITEIKYDNISSPDSQQISRVEINDTAYQIDKNEDRISPIIKLNPRGR